MGKIKIQYPVICFESIEIDMPDEKIDEVMEYSTYEQASFTKEMVAIHQPENKDWIHGDIESAFEMEYATIKRVKSLPAKG